MTITDSTEGILIEWLRRRNKDISLIGGEAGFALRVILSASPNVFNIGASTPAVSATSADHLRPH